MVAHGRAEHMNKWLVLLLVCVVLGGGGWYIARQQVMIPLWEQPKFGKVARGDIEVPITAAGLIHANQVVEVKSKASGRILEVPVLEGDYVKAGDAIVVLDPIDEQRMLDRAKADLDRTAALLQQSEVAVERAKVAVDTAKARLTELQHQGEIYEFDWNKNQELRQSGQVSEQDFHNSRAQYQMNLAAQESARIAVHSAELNIEDAEAAVLSQRAMVEGARQTFNDAQTRRDETTVLAPVDAVVTEVFVKPGMLVQSATQGFTGGTMLMTIADISKKKVIARLDEADYGRVLNVSPLEALPQVPELRAAAEQDASDMEQRSGTVKITVDAFPEETFTGRIERVEPQGKLNQGSSIIQFDVHVEITDDRRHMLPLGAQAQVEFTVESARDVVLVPADAVKTFQEQRGVYLKTRPERGAHSGLPGRQFVPCKFGISDGERTEVVEVLNGGELKDGADVYTRLPQLDDEDKES
jgi:multidrug efflux pump subunit AcrA (membrane-fusion protein)